MKKILFTLIAVVAVLTAVTTEQSRAQLSYSVFSNKAYTNSQIDTSNGYATPGGYYQLGQYLRVSLYFKATDSVNVKVYLDSKDFGGVNTWTVQDSTTLTSTNDTLATTEWVLRGGATGKAEGILKYWRLRNSFSTGNGTTSAKYWEQFWVR